MPIHIRCAACDYAFNVRDQFAGKKGKCPKCGNIFKAPAAGDGRRPARPPQPPPAPPKVSSATVQPAAVQPAPGSSVKLSGLPVGKALQPGDSSAALPRAEATAASGVTAGPATSVAPVPDFGIHDEPAGTLRPRHGLGHSHAHRKGMPVWGWLILLLAGGGAAGGWVYVATRKPASVASKSAATTEAAAAAGNRQEDGQPADDRDADAPSADRSETSAEDKTPTDGSTAVRKEKGKRAVRRPGTRATGDSSSKKTPGGAPTDAAEQPKQESYAAQIEQLAADCAAFQWKPATADQYSQMIELARLMSTARMGSSDEAAADVSERVFSQTLARIQWTPQLTEAINQFAGSAINQPSGGLLAIGTVEQVLSGAWLLKVGETAAGPTLVLLEVAPDQAEPEPGSRWLVIGLVDARKAMLARSEKPEEKLAARVINFQYLLKLPPPAERDPFAPPENKPK